jgi:hypothetical protein
MSNEARGLVKANFIEWVIVSEIELKFLYRKETSLLDRVWVSISHRMLREREGESLHHLG